MDGSQNIFASSKNQQINSENMQAATSAQELSVRIVAYYDI